MSVKLSVIIPCYNAADTVVAQLEALACQQWVEPWEVIVVDNGSTDETRALVEQFYSKLPALQVVDAGDKKGIAYARNMGARMAQGDMLAFCDADDQVAPGWVAAMGTALTKYDLVAGRLEAGKLNESWVLQARHCPQQNGFQEYKYPPYLPHSAGANLGVKRSVHQSIGGFDETLARLEDTDYCWRLQLNGVKLHFVPEALVHYRFRHTLTGIYSQAYGYAEYNVLLYKRYRSLGMPELSPWSGLFCWSFAVFRLLLKRFPRIRNKKTLAAWLWRFGRQMGRLHGCIKYRVLAF